MLASVNYEDTPEKCFAIGMIWNISSDSRNQFRNAVKTKLLPSLTLLRSTIKVTMVLSLRHKPLKIQGAGSDNAWTDYLLILLAPGVEPKEIWRQIGDGVEMVSKGISKSLLRVEVLRPQKMPMVFPRRHLRHVIEYVLSQPQRRAEYYNDQYMFSGPVIQRFLEEGAVGSFMGLEHVQYLQNNASLPEWDLIHIAGFKWRWLIKIMWVLYRNANVFHGIARKIGYKSAWNVHKSWDAKRTKLLRIAIQDASSTLLPLGRTSESHNVKM